jgi:hypothetical protein
MSMEPHFKDHDFYLDADYKPFQRSEDIAPDILPSSNQRQFAIPIDVTTGRLRESFELPRLNFSPTPIEPAIAFICQYPYAKNIDLTWSRQNTNSAGIALVKGSKDGLVGVGDRVFCQNMYGNGQIVRIEGWHGRYTILRVFFSNRSSEVMVRSLAVPFSHIRLDRRDKIRAILSCIFHPFVFYRKCRY